MLFASLTVFTEQEQERHAHRDAVEHLFVDFAVLRINDVGSELHAAVDGAGVHHNTVLIRQFEVFFAHAVILRVFGQGREQPAVHAFELNAQPHDDVRAR